jgi:hypothetical protein
MGTAQAAVGGEARRRVAAVVPTGRGFIFDGKRVRGGCGVRCGAVRCVLGARSRSSLGRVGAGRVLFCIGRQEVALLRERGLGCPAW